jgi:hypothetical protein
MTDLSRFGRSSSALAEALWDAARVEIPGPHIASRTLRTLGATSGVVVAASVAKASLAPAAGSAAAAGSAVATKGAATIVAKWTAAGVVTAMVAVGTGVELTEKPQTTDSVHNTAPTAPVVPRRGHNEPRALAAPAKSSEAEAVEPARTATHGAIERTPARTSTLAAEVALLQRARTALRGGDPQGALAALDRYDIEYSKGHLSLEAATLRMQALHRADHHIAAGALARRLLATHPQGPHAAQARSIAGLDSRDKMGGSNSEDGGMGQAR